MMEFLYFPQDKTKYIPAIISLIIFVAGAAATMYLLHKSSKREEERLSKELQKTDNSLPYENEK